MLKRPAKSKKKTVAAVSEALDVLNRHVNLVRRKRDLIVKPSQQLFKQEIKDHTDAIEAWQKLDPKKQYNLGAELREEVMAVIKEGSEFKDDKWLTAEQKEMILDSYYDMAAGEIVYVEIVLKELEVRKRAVERKAKELPVHDWWKSHKGLSSFGLGKIIGETGDLSNYANPGKVWARLGLHPYSKDGVTYKAGSTWKMEGGLSNDQWTEFGYNPRRRSDMFTIGEAVIKQKDGKYKEVYANRKKRECEKAMEEGLLVVTTQSDTAKRWKEQKMSVHLVKKIEPKKHRTVGRIHSRAQRYMEKQIIRDLWMEWNPDLVEDMKW